MQRVCSNDRENADEREYWDPVFLLEASLPERLRGPLHGHKTRGLGLMHCYTHPVQSAQKKEKEETGGEEKSEKRHIVLPTTLVYLQQAALEVSIRHWMST